MSQAFFGCAIFNADIGSWNTHNVDDMSYMFRGCTAFNQDISSWNTANVTNMTQVFFDCTNFDQDLSGWDISSMNNATEMFSGATLSTANYSALLIGWEAGTHQSGVTFHGGNATYNASGNTARITLVDTDGWTITDGGAA
jgi:surface protein